jgi:hypothetical protein
MNLQGKSWRDSEAGDSFAVLVARLPDKAGKTRERKPTCTIRDCVGTESSRELIMAEKTIVEKAGEAVGFGIAMAEDLAGRVKNTVGGAVTTVTESLNTAPAKSGVANKSTQKASPKKAVKAVTKKAAKKASLKETAKKAVKKAPATKVAKKVAVKKVPAKKTAKKSVKKAAKKSARRR